MKYIFKRLFCNHVNSIWVRPVEFPKGKMVYYPAKICQDCRKLFWVAQGSKIVTYVKPIKIGGN